VSLDLSPAAYDDLVARLRAGGCVFAEEEARLLASGAVTVSELADLVDRRVAGLPLEQVLGWAEFHGLRVLVEPGVFVPRRRTEFLVDRARELAGTEPVVVDLCCGTGVLGLATVAGVPGSRLYAADVDPAAVRCARRNLAAVGGLVFEGDLFEALPVELRGRVDVLLANVPYVPTAEIPLLPVEAREHEARVALDGGPDGLDVLRRVSAAAGEWLAVGGSVLVETSAEQAPAALACLTGDGLSSRIVTDDPEAPPGSAEPMTRPDSAVVIGRRR
jgi:release factor glutamine methyltransferase